MLVLHNKKSLSFLQCQGFLFMSGFEPIYLWSDYKQPNLSNSAFIFFCALYGIFPELFRLFFECFTKHIFIVEPCKRRDFRQSQIWFFKYSCTLSIRSFLINSETVILILEVKFLFSCLGLKLTLSATSVAVIFKAILFRMKFKDISNILRLSFARFSSPYIIYGLLRSNSINTVLIQNFTTSSYPIF